MYATAAQMQDRYSQRELIQVTDRATPPAGAVDTALVESAIEGAGRIMDPYLGVKYPVPVNPVPGAVREAALVIARYILHDDRATERIRQDYEDTMRWLHDIAAGKAILTELVPAGSSVGAAVRAPAAIFTDALTARMP